MGRLLPFGRSVDREDDPEPRLVNVDEEAADEVFAALSSQTARTILAALYDEPHTASELADIADTTVQNAQYHLEKFLDADLVTVVDTWYSDRGREMKVYAPADESLVVFAGDDPEESLWSLLSRLVGAVVVAGMAWVVYRRLGGLVGGLGGGGDGGPAATVTGTTTDGGGGVTLSGTATQTETVMHTGTEMTMTATTNTTTTTTETVAALQSAGGLDPLVAAGALVAVVAVVALLARRP